MVDKYRRKMTSGRRRYTLDRYKKHKESDGGIFTPDKRRKLLGIKPKRKVAPENLSNFWYDVRSSVQHGLADLHLVTEIANESQLKEMFSTIPYSESKEDDSKTDIAKLLKDIFSSQPRTHVYRMKGQLRPVQNKMDDVWLAHLAYDVVLECFQFFRSHSLVTSKAHERLIDETEDMLNSEIGRAWFVSREHRAIRF